MRGSAHALGVALNENYPQIPRTRQYSSGHVALIRLWDGVLTGGEVSSLAADPFAGIDSVPEPGTWLMALTGVALAIGRRYRRHSR